ncbi:MAG: RluA family pseudouridine synthase [Clostridia bacterium]|nr:RluA family pseudouridine synthase [Clostridia bacterium]
MQKTFDKNKQKRTGQVRDERSAKSETRGQVRVRGNKKEGAERVNGAPVYTAIYKVNRSDELMEFLLRKCGTSRNNVKALLVRKQVLVNGSVVTQYNFPLAKDDEVKLSKKPVKEGVVATRPTPQKRKTAPKPAAQIGIIFEDEDFLAVNKPVGLLSVESDKETECAYGYALEYMQAQSKNSRPYILHRIDKETSGVLVFAKNIKLHSMLKMHWNEQVTLREYFAVVEGIFEKKQGTVTTYLKENKNNVVYSTNDPTGQKAVTHYEVVKENGEYSLLKVQIETGRKNQIRVHMQALGCPVVGDDKYGKKQDGTQVKNPLSRLGLHASRLEFVHPITKEIMSFNASLPPSFRELFGK